PHATALLAAGGQLALAVAALVSGEPDGADALDWAVEVLEPDIDWLAQLGWSVAQVGSDQAAAEADAVRRRCRASGNDWGAALAAVIAAELWLHDPSEADGAPVLSAAAEAASTFDTFGAGVLAAWAAADRAAVMARLGDSATVEAALAAERRAVSAGTDLARARALWALNMAGQADRVQVELLRELARVGGLGEDRPAASAEAALTGRGAAEESGVPSTHVRCFGGLSVVRDGQALDLSSVKPRARSLLRLLAIHPGRALHREAIIEALWPEHDLAAGTRSLQVAVSSLRQLLEPGVRRGCSGFVVRDGDGYLLALPPGSTSDVATFAEAMGAGRDHLRHGRPVDAVAAFTTVVDMYVGELLPEEGPAEWVVKERHRFQMDAADAAAALGEHQAAQGDLPAAIQTFERCLAIDAYRDGIWRRLVGLVDQSGDRAAALTARRRYHAMLRELDLMAVDEPG
ncbi:MAG: BTAD domain-containing putative transcriptional regulator, partial [Acidimicrobiales bacterium]